MATCTRALLAVAGFHLAACVQDPASSQGDAAPADGGSGARGGADGRSGRDGAGGERVGNSAGGSPAGTGGTASSAAGGAGAGAASGAGNAAGTGAGANGGAAATADGGPGARDASTPPRRGASAGCGKATPGGDSSTQFVKHDVAVTGVDPAFVAAHPAANGGNWAARSFYLRLPAGYDPSMPYPLSIGGGGCGNTDGSSGKNGGLSTLPNGQREAIQVGLNYMYPENAGACFADDFVNTPDLPYFDAVLAGIEASYCVDRDRVFASGFSSGAWEAYLLGCARAGVVRGIGTAEGGLRKTRPPCTRYPVAAILVAGLSDTENPIGPLTPPGKNDSLGSAPARDELLARNGCVGTATAPWDDAYPACVKYAGCPAAYPVVWCAIDAGHTDGGDLSAKGFWKFWSSLPR